MTARRSGRRTAASVGRKRTVARQVGRRQSGKTDALSAAERLRLIRLVTCGGIFVLLVAAKLLLPGRMAGVSQKLSEAMTRSVDVQAVFSAVGGLFTKDGTPAEAADEVYRAVFHPEGAETRQTAARTADGAALTELRNWRDAEPLNTIPPAGEDPAPEELETMDLVLYSDEDLPENVSMRQAILGFDHETPVKGVLSSNFGYRDHPLEGTERFHYGVDLAADTGTAIACFADGTVTAVGESSSYGKYCTVTHANGCTTLYAHCGRISVSSGAAVKKGEKLGEVVGVVKAYSSCVGEGPFVCEMFGEEGQKLRDAGAEYGAKTGRPRRVGPIDLVATRYGVEVQGATNIALTKLDILSYMDKIPVCAHYELDGQQTDEFPFPVCLQDAKPVIEYVDGWKCDISKVRSWELCRVCGAGHRLSHRLCVRGRGAGQPHHPLTHQIWTERPASCKLLEKRWKEPL